MRRTFLETHPRAALAICCAIIWAAGCGGDGVAPGPDGSPTPVGATPAPTLLEVTPTFSEASPTPGPPPDATPTPASLAPTPVVEVISEAVDQVSQSAWEAHVRALSGEDPFVIGDQTYQLHTRYAYSEESTFAAYYLQSTLMEMGYAVYMQPFSCNGADAFNVIATLPGTQGSDARIVLGAHYDSTSESPSTDAPGADDNASGTAAVLEIARVMRQYVPGVRIDFVLFGAEEIGLCGSYFYVQQALLEDNTIVGAIILDMIGYYEHYTLVVEGEEQAAQWMDYAETAIETFTDLDADIRYNAWGSDHVPFLDAGIPAYLLIEYDWNHEYYHTTNDTIDHLSPEVAHEATRAALGALATTAQISPAQPSD